MEMTLVPVLCPVLECSRMLKAWMQSNRPGFLSTTRGARENV